MIKTSYPAGTLEAGSGGSVVPRLSDEHRRVLRELLAREGTLGYGYGLQEYQAIRDLLAGKPMDRNTVILIGHMASHPYLVSERATTRVLSQAADLAEAARLGSSGMMGGTIGSAASGAALPLLSGPIAADLRSALRHPEMSKAWARPGRRAVGKMLEGKILTAREASAAREVGERVPFGDRVGRSILDAVELHEVARHQEGHRSAEPRSGRSSRQQMEREISVVVSEASRR